MEIRYNKTGAERKALVMAVSEILGCEIKYKGAPSFAYEVDYFTISKDGTLSFDDMADSEEVEKLIDGLADRGFKCEETEAPDSLVIHMPRDYFTDDALLNLMKILQSKGELIKKAMGADNLPVKITAENVSFPWFTGFPAPENVSAYSRFIGALCAMAKNQQRVTAKAKETGNGKYAFRCFLLRLGFIGDEYKAVRKTLLENLSGSSSYAEAKSINKAVDEDE